MSKKKHPLLVAAIALIAASAISPSARAEIFALPTSDTLLVFEVTLPGLTEEKVVLRDGKEVKINVRKPIKISTREGTLFQFEDTSPDGKSYWYGFIANRTADKKSANVWQFRVEMTATTGARPEHHVRKPERTLDVGIGEYAVFLGRSRAKDVPVQVLSQNDLLSAVEPRVPATDITVRYLGHRRGSFPGRPPFTGEITSEEQIEFLRLVYGDPNDTICCVTCPPRRLCADSVDLDCGSCGGGPGGSLQN